MIYTLSNGKGISLKVSNFGCRIMELAVPDRNGIPKDIVLGRPNEKDYRDFGSGERFLGAAIGRYGNRIAGGRFVLDGREYRLALNNGQNSLHGGVQGFDMVEWEVLEANARKIEFRYISPDGEEGFPGELKVRMRYELTPEGELRIVYSAVADKPTIVNLTHHSFFNLQGEGEGDILDHILTINASRYLPVDGNLIPLGEPAPVEGTPFDFRSSCRIGERIRQKDLQLERGGGYDHNWILDREPGNGICFAARVVEPGSGRVLEVFTTEPGMQFYSGNYFNGSMAGKKGGSYVRHCALALETQHYPDSPNHPDYPSTVLRPGETYRQTCIYKFSILK